MDREFKIVVHNVIEDLDGDGVEDFYDPDIDGDGFSNEEEISYGSDSLNPESVANVPPSGITSSLLKIQENDPAGTIVGQFSATDPDSKSVFSFYLTENNTTDNQLFTIDSNGSLRSIRPFDYETAISRDISVGVSDQHNASKELNFVVDIIDLVENLPPEKITISSNQIEENAPVGSVVGTLRSIDPDDPNRSGTYQYQILNQDIQNQAFDITGVGIVVTKMVMDFEFQDSYVLTIRSTDIEGAHYDQNLSIRVRDTFIPIVDTNRTVSVSGLSTELHGIVVDPGSSNSVKEWGFLLSLQPNPKLLDSKTRKLIGSNFGENSSFHAPVSNLYPSKKYFFRAYAMNAEGVGYGSVEDFLTPSLANSPAWASAQSLGVKDWWESSWMGSFYLSGDTGWILHQEIGWLFPVRIPENGVWFWHGSLGWIWTNQTLYPFFYDNQNAAWVYFYGSVENQTLFYNYSTQKWMQLNASQK